MTKITSDGTTASYYQLPEGATELQHLISHRNLNAQDGEIFRAIYRKGRASHSDELRDARKVLFYAQAEVERLEALQPRPIIRELYTDADQEKARAMIAAAWEEGEKRMEQIGPNGNDGLAYEPEWIPNNGQEPDLLSGTRVDIKFADGNVEMACSASSWIWERDGASDDITHYRVAWWPEHGWIPTNGKEPRLPDDTLIDIKFAEGDVAIGRSADCWIWEQDGDPYDITHYRIHQPE